MEADSKERVGHSSALWLCVPSNILTRESSVRILLNVNTAGKSVEKATFVACPRDNSVTGEGLIWFSLLSSVTRSDFPLIVRRSFMLPPSLVCPLRSCFCTSLALKTNSANLCTEKTVLVLSCLAIVWGFPASGMIYLVRSSYTIKTPTEIIRNFAWGKNSGSAILQQSWCWWLRGEQPVCKNMGQKRVTCKGKVDRNTKHFKIYWTCSCRFLVLRVPWQSIQFQQPLGTDWDLLTLLKCDGFPEHCFSAYPIFAEDTHSKEDFSKLYTIVENFKAYNECGKSHNRLSRFLRPSSREYRHCFEVTHSPSGNVVWQLEKRTLLTRKWNSSRYVVYVYFHLASSFSSCVKPFDIKGLSKWDKTEGCNACAGLFLPMIKMKPGWVHTGVCVVLAGICT